MGDLSKHFSRAEFACKCGKCRPIAIDYELINILEHLRVLWGSPIKITSGYRCTQHNAKVGGARTSMHLTGKAADIQIKDVSPSDVQSYLKGQFNHSGGLGCYPDFTHIDTRDNAATWAG